MDLGNEKTILLELLLSYNNGMSAVRVPDFARRTGMSPMNIEQELSKLAKEHIMRRVTAGTYAFNVDIGGLRSYVLSKEPMGGGRNISPYSRSVTVDEIVNSVWEPDVPLSEKAQKEAMRENLRENRAALRKRIEELEKKQKQVEYDEKEEDEAIADLEDEEDGTSSDDDDFFPEGDKLMFPQDDEDLFPKDDEDLFSEDEEEEDPILRMIREDIMRGIGQNPFSDDDEDDEEEEGEIPVEPVDETKDGTEDPFPDTDELKKVAEELSKQASPKGGKKGPVVSEFDAKVVQSVEESLAQQVKKRLAVMAKTLEPISKFTELFRSPVGQFACKLGESVYPEGNGLKVVLPDEYFPLRAVNIVQEDGLLYMNDGGLLEKFFMEGELKADGSRILFCLAAHEINRRDGIFYLDVSEYMEPDLALRTWKKALDAVREGNAALYDARVRKWETYEELFHAMLQEEGTDTRDGAIAYLYKKTSELMNKDIVTVMNYVDIRLFVKSLSDEEYDTIREIALSC